MNVPRLVLAVLAVLAATACGAARTKPIETPGHVASLIRATWGAKEGSPLFTYSCRGLDERGRLFTCVVEDHNRWVRLARFDVTCDASRCTWIDYPAYVG